MAHRYTKRQRRELACRLLTYFQTEEDTPPSLLTFALREGLTPEALDGLCREEPLRHARQTALQLRREHLIGRALTRRYDPSFVKYLLDREGAEEGADSLTVQIEVVP